MKSARITAELKKTLYFVERDLKLLLSYRFAFVMMFSSVFFNLIYMVLFGSMFGTNTPAAIKPYGTDYISYILVGSVGWSFMWSIAGATSSALRNEMLLGTFESILLTGTELPTMMVAYMIFGSLFGLISMGVIILIGIAILGISALSGAGLATLVLFLISIIMMGGFGMLFGGLTIWVKNIGQAFPVFQNISMIFAGVYFPLSVIPSYIRWLALLMPFYYQIEGIRLSLVPGKEVLVWHYVLMSALFAIILLVLGVASIHFGLNRARREGTTMFY